MSGGFFEYKEYNLLSIAEAIEEVIEEDINNEISEDVKNILKDKAILYKKEYQNMKLIDKYLSGDIDSKKMKKKLI